MSAVEDLQRACSCLYIAVEDAIARDVDQKATAVIKEIEMLRAANEAAVSQEQISRVEANRLRGERDEAIAQAKQEEEKLRMMLVAVMTASMQNTETTIKDRIDQNHLYWSQAYADVCVAVDREMRERGRAEKAEAACAEKDAALSKCSERWKWFVQHPGAPIINIASMDAAVVKADEIVSSPDCGKGWKSPEEYAAIEAKCAEMRRALESVGHSANWAAKITYALSDDCGEGWKSPEEYSDLCFKFKELRDDLAFILNELQSVSGCSREGSGREETVDELIRRLPGFKSIYLTEHLKGNEELLKRPQQIPVKEIDPAIEALDKLENFMGDIGHIGEGSTYWEILDTERTRLKALKGSTK